MTGIGKSLDDFTRVEWLALEEKSPGMSIKENDEVGGG